MFTEHNGVYNNVMLFSKLKGVSAKIPVCTPRFCTVYAVSKGKLSSLRPSDVELDETLVDDSSDTSCSTNTSSNYTSTSLIGLDFSIRAQLTLILKLIRAFVSRLIAIKRLIVNVFKKYITSCLIVIERLVGNID